MSLAVRVLIALVAGFGAGLVASTFGAATAGPIADVLQPVGTLWVSAIRMAIIPLVIAALVVGVGGARDTRTVGVLGMRGLVMFLVILAAAGVFSARWIARRIGGYTGDTLGAVQQKTETVFLVVAALFIPH